MYGDDADVVRSLHEHAFRNEQHTQHTDPKQHTEKHNALLE